MQVGLLGPLEVADAGDWQIQARKCRAVLALLALRAGSVVRREEIYDAVWGDEPPRSAPKLVQGYISDLRQALPPGSIETVSGHYVLRVSPEDIDVTRFERLVRAGSEALLDGDPRAALIHLRQAAALWRGEPLPDLSDQPLGMAEAARLTELHRTAEERAFDARLTLGEHDSLIGDLEAAVGREPLRERRWEQLMLALYRAGRQADALRAFQRLRAILGEELGIEPGTGARALEAAILAHDPALQLERAVEVPARPAQSQLPTGNVTFLVAEVADATRLIQRLGPKYADVARQQRQVLVAAVSRHDGIEAGPDGEGSVMVFGDASNAMAACLDGQRSLVGQAWPEGCEVSVRMGLHTGIARPTSDGLYISLAAHEAARICAAAHGGQILLSADTARIVRRDLPEGSVLADRGSFRLSGFDEPERIFQLVHPDLESSFPPLLASPAQSHNLPDIRMSFVGREADLASVERLLAEERLVTVLGPGGAGKTRLAVEVAARVAGGFEDGVRLCDLSPLDEPGLVPSAVCASFGIRDVHDADPLAELTRVLQGERVLLLLDNCEHLAGAAAAAASTLLAALPDLTVLATSRQPLGIEVERVWRIAPLDVPAEDAGPTVIRQSDSVLLFESRARFAQPGFTVDDRNAVAVGTICRELDGLPLAIELVAAQVATLEPTALAERLRGRPQLVRARPGQQTDRHRTLEATVEWSYRLLDDQTRRLLRFLSVFANGFNVDAAKAVSDASDPVDLLTDLVDSSLVVWDPDASRYRLLEPIRAFARAHLDDAGEADVAGARHLAWCAQLADSLKSGPGSRDSYELFNRELDNLRVALAWAATHASVDNSRLAEAVRDPIVSPPDPGLQPPAKEAWEAVVCADRDYFDRMDADGAEFPAAVPERTFALTEDLAMIGRASPSRGIRPEIDLSAAPIDIGISREHALLMRRADGGWAVVDTGSTNGIYLNNSDETLPMNRITDVADGDLIHLGAWTTITIRRVKGDT